MLDNLEVIQLLNSATLRRKHESHKMDSVPTNNLVKLISRSFQRSSDWSSIDRLKLRQLSRAHREQLGQYVCEAFLQQPEDLLKVSAEFPNLRKVIVAIPTNDGCSQQFYQQLSKFQGLQELELRTPQAVDAFASAVKDSDIAANFGNCQVRFKYQGWYNRQQTELDNISTISQRMGDARIVLDYTVGELVGTRGPRPLLRVLEWLDNVYLCLKFESSDVDYATMQYVQDYICTRKEYVLEAGFVGGEHWVEDHHFLNFLNDNSTLRKLSFGHPSISKDKKVCYLSKAHVKALQSVPELEWTLYSSKEWDMLGDFPNIVKISMAETQPPPKISFWQMLPRLQELELSLSSSRGTSLRVLSELKNLRTLVIKEHGRQVPPPWLDGLGNVTQITKLKIYVLTASISSNQLQQSLTYLTGLRYLSMEFRLLNISNLCFVVGLQNLEVLKLRSVEHLRNEVVYFQQLKKLLNLREFHFQLFKNNKKYVEEIKRMLPSMNCRIIT
eukprot:TRINITY_DN18780_c0_g1_i11.p1 TRINITY_DN18780_c0_g1~~TRINITY_DN18780_c0_g1_i11.p1  ORF type:complete len:500 (+),score=48.22 TRINITY_DN18780_c0_g1_i11:228-1727(+)